MEKRVEVFLFMSFKIKVKGICNLKVHRVNLFI